MGDDLFDLMERRMARLERKMRELFEEAFQPSWDLSERALEPLFEVEDLEDEVVVTVDLPGVRDKKELEVHCTENALEIRARMCQPVSFRRWGTVQRDADFDCYHKIIPLPAEVDPDRATASFKDGILTMHLPKRIRRHKVRIL